MPRSNEVQGNFWQSTNGNTSPSTKFYVEVTNGSERQAKIPEYALTFDGLLTRTGIFIRRSVLCSSFLIDEAKSCENDTPPYEHLQALR